MTALVPTIGHRRMIDFARGFMGTEGDFRLYLFLSSRSFEPKIRSVPLDFYTDTDHRFVIVDHVDDGAPQNCESDEDWKYWTDLAKTYCDKDPDYVFASESYGAELARRFGCQFIPVDIGREVFPVKGTSVREDFWNNQDKIIPEWIDAHRKKFVLFGQESVGKTTLARNLSDHFRTPFYHEWARPYLESVGSYLTPDKMENIARGQRFIDNETPNHIVKIQDTNIISTYGFYNFWGITHKPKWLYAAAKQQAHDAYYIIPSPNIPFEQDQLRYGGDKRETSMQYWIDELESLGTSRYLILDSSDAEERFCQCVNYIEQVTGVDELVRFQRD